MAWSWPWNGHEVKTQNINMSNLGRMCPIKGSGSYMVLCRGLFSCSIKSKPGNHIARSKLESVQVGNSEDESIEIGSQKK